MPETDVDPALSLATAEQICKELASRYPGLVVLMERDDDGEFLSIRYQGGSSRALGMMQKAVGSIRRAIRGCDGDGGGN